VPKPAGGSAFSTVTLGRLCLFVFPRHFALGYHHAVPPGQTCPLSVTTESDLKLALMQAAAAPTNRWRRTSYLRDDALGAVRVHRQAYQASAQDWSAASLAIGL